MHGRIRHAIAACAGTAPAMGRVVYLGVGAVALVSGFWMLRGEPAATAPAPPVAAVAPAISAEAELRGELRQLRGQVADISGHLRAPAPEAAEADDAVPAPSPDESAARFEHALAAQIGSEGDDPTWSRKTEARIADVLRGEVFVGTRLRTARCQRTLCRIDLAHDDGDAQDEFLARVTHTPPFNTRGYIKPSLPGEPATTEIYVTRDGHKLPVVN
jgi:hypothetical protein